MQQQSIQGFRLSPQQERLWALQGAGRGLDYYAQCAALVEGGVDARALASAVEDAVSRHEILRTTFLCLPGMEIPLQAVSADALLWDYEEKDAAWTHEDAEAKAPALLEELRALPVDFENGPLLRLRLYNLPGGRRLLLLSVPALCADAAGLRNLLDEIGRCYAARVRGAEEPAQPVQYADVAELFNDLLKTEEMRAGREFWKRQPLADIASQRLPFESNAAEAQAFAPEMLPVAMDTELSRRVRECADRHGVSSSDLLLACWQILLRRLTGEDEVFVSPLFDGRVDEDLKDAVGLFARFLPISSRLADEPSFADALKGVHASVREAAGWQEYFSWPEAGAAGENLNRKHLSPYGFEFTPEPAAGAAGPLSFTVLAQRTCLERFKLRLACFQNRDAVVAQLHYDAAVYRAEDVERLARQYETLLRSALEEPARKINALDLVGAEEREWITEQFDSTAKDFGAVRCVHQLFEEQAARTPDSIALTFRDEELTYAELDARAGRLARRLRALGVGPESLVAVCLERSPEMVVSLLAVLKAGGAYLPLDPAYPAERLSFMLEDSGARLLVTEAGLAGRFDGTGAEVICVGDEQDDADVSGAAVGVTPENLAYVIYTSGSTGKPKGVMISHRAIANRLLWMRDEFSIGESDRVLQKTPFSFDASVWEFFVPLLSGATLVMAEPQGHQDSRYLADAVEKYQITILQLVPSVLELFLGEAGLGQKCRSLRLLCSGGEALSRSAAERFAESCPWAELTNLYGPTEVSIDATYWRRPPAGEGGPAPIGRPLANVGVYLLAEGLRLAAVGEAAEIYVAGAGLARGYKGRSGLTAERFVPHPFAREAGQRLYRTGDVGRYRADGAVEYLGRSDEQVKVRGFRIETGEVEAVLRQHESVREVVVVAAPDVRPGQTRLVAYAVAREAGAGRLEGALREYLGERLPQYMVPSSIVELERLPLLPNGKVDKKGLPSPEAARLLADENYVAPATPTEERVAEMWCELLNMDRVSVEDNFFELGGHSLLASRLIARLREELQVELPLKIMFGGSPTVRGLGGEIERYLIEQSGVGDIAEALKEFDDLSEEEMMALLAIEEAVLSDGD